MNQTVRARLIRTKRSKSVTHSSTLQKKIVKKKAKRVTEITQVFIRFSRISILPTKRCRLPIESEIKETKWMLISASLQATILRNDLVANAKANKTLRRHLTKHNNIAIHVRPNFRSVWLTYRVHQCVRNLNKPHQILQKMTKTKTWFSKVLTTVGKILILVFSSKKKIRSKKRIIVK